MESQNHPLISKYPLKGITLFASKVDIKFDLFHILYMSNIVLSPVIWFDKSHITSRRSRNSIHCSPGAIMLVLFLSLILSRINLVAIR